MEFIAPGEGRSLEAGAGPALSGLLSHKENRSGGDDGKTRYCTHYTLRGKKELKRSREELMRVERE